MRVSAYNSRGSTALLLQAAELQSLADDKSDPAMAALADGEREALLAALPDLQRRLLLRLLPQDEADSRSAVLEVRCILLMWRQEAMYLSLPTAVWSVEACMRGFRSLTCHRQVS